MRSAETGLGEGEKSGEWRGGAKLFQKLNG